MAESGNSTVRCWNAISELCGTEARYAGFRSPGLFDASLGSHFDLLPPPFTGTDHVAARRGCSTAALTGQTSAGRWKMTTRFCRAMKRSRVAPTAAGNCGQDVIDVSRVYKTPLNRFVSVYRGIYA